MMDEDMGYLIGCDIGGTTFSSSLFDKNLGKIATSSKESVNPDDDTDIFLNKIKKQL